MAPIGHSDPPNLAPYVKQIVDEELGLLGDDHEIGTSNVVQEGLPVELKGPSADDPVVDPGSPWHFHCVVLLRADLSYLAVDQVEFDSMISQVIAKILKERKPIVRNSPQGKQDLGPRWQHLTLPATANRQALHERSL